MSLPATAIGAMPSSAAIGATSASTAIASSPGAGLPTVDEAHAPAYVRTGSAAVKRDYATAVGFEEMLLDQLSQSLVQSSGLSGEEAGGGEGEEEGVGGQAGLGAAGEGGGGMVGAMPPQTLAEGLARDGGLGLAAQMMRALDPAAAQPASLTGGSSA